MKRQGWWGMAGLILVTTVAAQGNPPGEDLARKSGCFFCHSIDRHKIGPSFRQIAHKYAGQMGRTPDVVNQLADKIRYGHSSTAKMVMRRYRSPSKADLDVIARWILSSR
jgi:cytochrome c